MTRFYVIAIYAKIDRFHRRVQDFVRGGAKALLAPGGGGGKALLARASLFGGAIFCVGGGPRPPWPPPLDPRMGFPNKCLRLSDYCGINFKMASLWVPLCPLFGFIVVTDMQL